MRKFQAKISLFFIILLAPFFGNGQELVLEKVRWEESGVPKTKLHIKEVIAIDSIPIGDIREMTGKWLESRYIKQKQVFRYGFNPPTGDFEWHVDRRRPLIVNDSNRILTSSLKCEKCVAAMKSSKRPGDGYFSLNFEFKTGRFLLVMSDFYGIDADSYLANYLIKRGTLVKRPDHRIDFLEVFFTEIKNDLLDFIINSAEQKKKSKGVDDW